MDTAAIMKTLLALTLLTLLITSPVAAAQEMVKNGDFSDNDVYSAAYWTQNLNPSGGTATLSYGTVTGLGSKTCAVYFTAVTGRDTVSASLSQAVDLTHVDVLSFDLTDTQSEQYRNFAEFVVLIGNTQVFSIDPYDLYYKDWETYTVDTSAYTGEHTITFKLILDSAKNPHTTVVALTDVSAMTNIVEPVYQSSSVDSVARLGAATEASITVTGGSPSTGFYLYWGDGATSDRVSSTQGTFTETFTHTYVSNGTYTVTAFLIDGAGNRQSTFTIGTVEVVSLDFSAYPTSGNPPLTVQFSAEGTNIASVLWDFGDGATSTQQNPVHTYAASPNPYTVTLTGYTASGKTIQVPKENLISASAQYISWDKTTYEAGETAELTWSLRNPDFSTYSYTIQILPSDSQGNIGGSSSVIT
ncbi:PKD domain-containing protein, partial [Methanocorpusculum sp.]|nr:PKD domain-containing protein [Methanocorpusculum sp.]